MMREAVSVDEAKDFWSNVQVKQLKYVLGKGAGRL